MAFSRPTLTQLIERIGTDLKTRLGLAGAVLRRSVIGILARVYAAAVHSLYGYLASIAQQAHPLTAEGRYLDLWASLWKIHRKPAALATGLVTFKGMAGSEIPKDTIIKRTDGVEYRTIETLTISGSEVPIQVTAIEGGTQGNMEAGTALSLIAPIAGVQTVALSEANGFISGADSETDTELRTRLLARIQHPPQGGTKQDYRQWALSVQGVTRAFVFENYLGGGTVGVSFVTDNAAQIIPDDNQVEAVRQVIETQRPLMVDVSVFAPINVVVDFVIVLSPNRAEVRAAVRHELEDLFRRESEPTKTLLLSHLNEAISIAVGEDDHELLIPEANITLAENEIATVGMIVW